LSLLLNAPPSSSSGCTRVNAKKKKTHIQKNFATERNDNETELKLFFSKKKKKKKKKIKKFAPKKATGEHHQRDLAR
jgi:hypothetical protein